MKQIIAIFGKAQTGNFLFSIHGGIRQENLDLLVIRYHPAFSLDIGQ